MLKALIKTRLWALLSGFTKGKEGKRRTTGGIITVAVISALLIAYIVGAMSVMLYGICAISVQLNQTYAVFTLGVIIATGLSIIGSIFTTKSQIFESKDNELLLSMPIKQKDIFLSRIIPLLLINLGFESVIMLPCIVIYGILVGYTAVSFIFAMLIYILIPFITLALSTVIAWVVAEIASRMKNKTLVSVILFVLFFGAYMVGAFFLGYNSEEMANIDLSPFENIPVFSWAGLAVSEGAALEFVLFALVCIVPSIITYIILDKCFIRIITSKRVSAKFEYKGNLEKSTTVLGALTKKEIRRFFSSASYVLNAGMGNIMAVLFSVMILAYGKEMSVILTSPELAIGGVNLSGVVKILPCVLIGFVALMNTVSAPSFSLESKSLWILKSAPVSTSDIIFSKLICHITVCLPLSIISTALASIGFGLGVGDILLNVVAIIFFVVFGAYLGIFFGIKYPKFDWKNETEAVKQGIALIGSMLGGMLYGVIMFVAGVALTVVVSPYLAFAVMLLVSALICLAIHLYLNKKGEGLIMAMNG